jgi:hypothetical protein
METYVYWVCPTPSNVNWRFLNIDQPLHDLAAIACAWTLSRSSGAGANKACQVCSPPLPADN